MNSITLFLGLSVIEYSICLQDEYFDDNEPTVKPLTTHYLDEIDALQNIAVFDDAEHRGPNWYSSSENEKSKTVSDENVSSESLFSSEGKRSKSSQSASSRDTRESGRLHAMKFNRACVPCPQDMLKRYSNKGIVWICGGYQRARRSFKSECMMRFRNCQDGTMFVKYFDGRCQVDHYHGRSWFYNYNV